MRTTESSVSSVDQHPPSGMEPWLLICLLAMVPGLLIVVLPHERLVPWLAPIIGSMVGLLALGLFMLWRTGRRRAAADSPAAPRDAVGHQR